MKRNSVGKLAVSAFVTVWVIGSSMAVRAQETKTRTASDAVFRGYCAVCHNAGENWKKAGPSLQGLFRRKQLVTGKPVNEGSVEELILEGGPRKMPGFRYTLSPEQVKELIRFLQTI